MLTLSITHQTIWYVVPCIFFHLISTASITFSDQLAGSDTTAISLRAIFYYLIKNPRCYKNMQAEIDEADRNGNLSEHVGYAECLQLPYLYVL